MANGLEIVYLNGTIKFQVGKFWAFLEKKLA